ncbi:M23 family metallopeptidase [Bacillus sp. UMB0728]|uniref:M23 family metallopeptidase n=1 Tax=Bacillus sp. UMB0728 TaxID=2066052 RepID=UPI0015DFDC72|nr:M23 family metallopeptidase [Bacillus sp. UMB0728]
MYKITSSFGQRETFRNSGHNGIDFAMPEGTPLRSIRNGFVEKIIDYGNSNAGKCVKVKWEDGKTAIYGHLSKFGEYKEGDPVRTGDVLGLSGHSGSVYGANGNHLHFGLRGDDGAFINPSPYIHDIQNMNNSANQLVQQSVEIKLSFFDYFQQHMNLLGGALTDLKVNFIHFIALSDYSPVVKILQNILQFIFFNS